LVFALLLLLLLSGAAAHAQPRHCLRDQLPHQPARPASLV